RRCCFFFSSRRRHTRFSRDWSSDVCSSDLVGGSAARGQRGRRLRRSRSVLSVQAQRGTVDVELPCCLAELLLARHVEAPFLQRPAQPQEHPQRPPEIASGRPSQRPPLGGELIATGLVLLPLVLRRAMPVTV